jgi:hypothetical protein
MAANEQSIMNGRRLGRMPARATRKALMFRDFVKFLKIPVSQTYWRSRKPIPIRSYGNNSNGCCTIASQAVLATRMERLEQKRTIQLTDEEILRVYYALTQRLYGGGDTGAYETDALDNWRNPDLTFRDPQGNPLTIDAYLRLNASDHDEVKLALALSGAKGIKLCFNLPAAWSQPAFDPPATWTATTGAAIGPWMPGSWGGHSMTAHGYTREGVLLDQTWDTPPNLVTWEAMSTYCDEAHVVIDSLDSWRTQLRAAGRTRELNLGDVRDAVNAVSAIHI